MINKYVLPIFKILEKHDPGTDDEHKMHLAIEISKLFTAESKAYLMELLGPDDDLYRKEKASGKFDWRVEREIGANELRAALRAKLSRKDTQ